jgi:GTP-binding protein
LRARLYRELETNVSLRLADGASADEFVVSGRGELHLSVLIETMRREGYELQVSRPEVITKEIDGKRCEPMEHLVIDTFEQYIGAISENMSKRLSKVTNLHHDGRGNVRLEYIVPTRGLIGFRNQFLTLVQGNGAMATLFDGYAPWQGSLPTSRNGALIASEAGIATM